MSLFKTRRNIRFMSPRELRVGRNQDLFREVNERIAELAVHTPGDIFIIVCECANTGCAEMVKLPLEEYGRIRSEPGLYVVLFGHEGTEPVEERHSDYLVVRTE